LQAAKAKVAGGNPDATASRDIEDGPRPPEFGLIAQPQPRSC
jgi:hypothetical protein